MVSALVLVVEDEALLREVMCEALSDEGYEVIAAENGAEALHAVLQRRPDVILLDLNMPVVTGWEFLEEYRKLGKMPLPVLVLSATLDAARGRLGELGVQAYLPKPFELNDLLESVRQIALQEPADAWRGEQRNASDVVAE